MLPLCLFNVLGAFAAANAYEWLDELLLLAMAYWSGREFSLFYDKQQNKRKK